MDTSLKSARGVCLLALALLLAAAWEGTVSAQSGRAGAQKPARKFDLDAWGRLVKLVKGSEDVYEVKYYKKTGTGPKAKLKLTAAFLKVAEETPIYRDVRVPLGRLSPDEKVLIFGKPLAKQVPDRTGRGRSGVDSQIQNARAILSGDLSERIPFNRQHVDARSPEHKWCEATVTKSGGGLAVKYSGMDTRVLLGRGAPILKRVKVDRKHLKGRLTLQMFGKSSSERPETKRESDAEKESYEAAVIVVLDRASLRTTYPLMWER